MGGAGGTPPPRCDAEAAARAEGGGHLCTEGGPHCQAGGGKAPERARGGKGGGNIVDHHQSPT